MIKIAELWQQQIYTLKADTEYLIVDGGKGTAKTTGCILRLFNEIRQQPGGMWMILMQTTDQISSVVLREWKNLIHPDYYTIEHRPWRIDLPKWNTWILLQYADHPRAQEKIRGTSLAGYYISQGESLRFDDLSYELDQSVRVEGFKHLRMVDTNGGLPSRVVFRRFIDEGSDEYVGKGVRQVIKGDTSVSIGKNITRIHIKTRSHNSVYTDETLSDWKAKYPQALYDRMVEGQWVAGQGQIYNNANVIDEGIRPDDIDSYWIGLDPGTGYSEGGQIKGNLALVWVGYQPRLQRYVVFAERLIVFTGMADLIAIINGVNSSWGEHKFRYMIKDWAGGSGGVIRREVPWAIYEPASKSSKSRKDFFPVMGGVNLIYESFAQKRLWITKSCEGILRDIDFYTYNADGSAPDKRQYDSHLLDALRYAWIRLSKWNKPT